MSTWKLARVALLCVTLAWVAACTGPRIYSNVDPDARWSLYSTFGFEPKLGTDRPDGPRSILSTYLVSAARAEMEKRGYRYQEEAPDLLLNFYLKTEQKLETRTMPSGGGYYGYRAGYYGVWGGYDKTITTQYTEGTLNIDLVDAKRNQLVWEGIAVGRLREDAREKLAERVPGVVADVFSRFPVQPAQTR